MKFLMGVLGMFALAGCSDDTAALGGAGGGSPAGGGGGAAGDCDGVACADDEYCGFDDGCDGPRSCQAKPTACETMVACGCDGENYATSCDALAASGGVSAAGACTPAEGEFICNYEYQVPIYCELGSEYCKVEPTQNVYMLGCEPLPAACTEEIPTDCDCLADPCSDNYCGIDETNGSVTVLCALPM